MKKKFILFSLICFFLINCTKVKGPVPDAVSVSACDTGYWYDGHIESIITTKCASLSGCHGASSPGGVPYTTYDGVKYDVDQGLFNTRVFVDKDMPQSPGTPLTAAELDRLSCWLSKGAPQTGSNSGTSGCSATISYSATIAPIMSTSCNTPTGCHESGSVNGDFTIYSGLSAKVSNGTLNTRVVVVKDMTTFPYVVPSLSPAQIGQIDCWIQQGGLNN